MFQDPDYYQAPGSLGSLCGSHDICSPGSNCSSVITTDTDMVKIEQEVISTCDLENISTMCKKKRNEFDDIKTEGSAWIGQDLDALKMEDIFQVDEMDLMHSPTLAELNSVDESCMDLFEYGGLKSASNPASVSSVVTSSPPCKKTVTVSAAAGSAATAEPTSFVTGHISMISSIPDLSAPEQKDLLTQNPGLRALLSQPVPVQSSAWPSNISGTRPELEKKWEEIVDFIHNNGKELSSNAGNDKGGMFKFSIFDYVISADRFMFMSINPNFVVLGQSCN